jgi:hypothetical protein
METALIAAQKRARPREKVLLEMERLLKPKINVTRRRTF